MKINLIIAAALASLSAQAGLVKFESDSIGSKPNGFQSADSSQVTFSDTLGADLSIYNGSESNGNSLGVFSDDTSALRMTFSSDFTTLSVSFGNDDPGFSSSGDLARLILKKSGSQVGLVDVVMNRNDLMDQTVSFTGAAFDEAIFQYVNPSGNGINLIEVVDNIQFDSEVQPVPEVQHYAMFAGMALVGAEMFRRKKQAA